MVSMKNMPESLMQSCIKVRRFKKGILVLYGSSASSSLSVSVSVIPFNLSLRACQLLPRAKAHSKWVL